MPDVNPSNPGKIINHTSSLVLSTYPDQLSPYYAYGMTKGKSYNGTLFRLPLRTAEQATTSLLSSRHFSPDDMMELLKLLELESSSMLLFLKHIERIEICQWEHGSAEPQEVYAANIAQVTKQLRQLRSAATNIPPAPVYSDYAMSIDCKGVDRNYVETWYVCNQLGGQHCSEIARDPKHKLLRLIPWGGVAARISTTEMPINSQRIYSGLAYCFLPLPIHTALPVMVNGFFELSSNRRDIWQSSEDMIGEGRTRAEWNVSLMIDIISPSYVRLLNAIRTEITFLQMQQLFPDFRLPAPWDTIAQGVYRNIFLIPLLQSVSLNGCASWIKCSEAVLLPDPACGQSERDILMRTIRALKLPFVECIPSLHKSLVESKTCTLLATPRFMREKLQAVSPISSKSNVYVPPQEDCRYLLSYCLSDITRESISSVHGLPLLPLVDGGVGCIRVLSSAQIEMAESLLNMGFGYVAVQQAVLKYSNMNDCIDNMSQEKNSTHMYIYTTESGFLQCFQLARHILIQHDLINKNNIEFVASFGAQTNVQVPSPHLLLDILREILPASFYAGQKSIETSSDVADVAPFLRSLWGYLHHHPQFFDPLVDSIPIVPSVSSHIYVLSRQSNMILQTYHDDALPDSAILPLNLLDVPIANIPIPKEALKIISAPTRSGVLSVLSRIPSSMVKDLDGSVKNALLLYFADYGSASSLTLSDISILKSLPIYPTRNNSFIPVSSDHCFMANVNQLSPELFPENLIHTPNVQLQQLLLKVGIPSWSRGQYFSKYFLPSLERLYQDQALRPFVLHDLKVLFIEFSTFAAEDHSFVSLLKEVSCVPSMTSLSEISSNLSRIDDLYDPAIIQLRELLPDTFFPAEEFQRGDILQHLREVGLKTSLAWPGIVSCASSISNMENNGHNYAAADVVMTLRQYRGCMLLNYLTTNRKLYEKDGFSLKSLFVSSVDNTEYIEQLLHISWVPVHPSSPEPHLPWKSTSDLGTPCDVRPDTDMLFCSSSRCISLVPLAPHIQKLFRINLSISVDLVAMQLRDLSLKYQELKTSTDVNLQQCKENISCIIPALYQRLNHQPDSTVKQILDGYAWIWLGGDFVSPHQVAYESKLSLAPHLFVVPQDLTVYHNLLQLFHIKPTFNTMDYVSTIDRIAHNSSSPTYDGDVNDYASIAVLKDEEFDLVTSLLNLIYNDNCDAPYVPDTNRKLIAPKLLVYDDVPWLTSSNYSTVRMGLKFSHGNISHKMASKFGVKSLRLMLVSSNSDDIYTTTDSNIESFGQVKVPSL